MEVSGQLHAPAALPRLKNLRYPLYRRGWVGPRADLNVLEWGKNFLTLPVAIPSAKIIVTYVIHALCIHICFHSYNGKEGDRIR
jgi:hypothetical protein